MALTSELRRSPRRNRAAGAAGPRERARAAAPWALGVVVLSAPELLGGIYPWAMAITAACAGVALALALAGARESELAPPLLVAVAVAPWLWTALQAAPLPCDWTAVLSPLSAQRLREAHALVGDKPPEYCPLTRDPGATREELLKGIAIASSMLAAGVLAARGRHRPVFLAVGLSTAVLALVAFGHALTDAQRVFGLYTPFEIRGAPFVAPLLNLNTLGGLLAMGVPVWMGFAFEARSGLQRATSIACVVVISAAALMTRSRGAAGAIAMGAALFAALSLWRARPSRSARAALAPHTIGARLATPLAVACAFGIAGYAWFDELAVEFRAGGWDKVELIAAAARFALASPWLGVGRGAFGNAFVGAVENDARFEYAESVLVQWACDWGLPAAIALTGALAVLIGRAAREARSSSRIGAIAGVCVIAAQNFVDLGLELLGPATVAAALLGAAVVAPTSREPRPFDAVVRRVSWLVVAAALVAPASMVLKLSAEHTASVEQELLASAESNQRAAFAARLRRAVLAHPSEPTFPLIAAHEALAHGDRSAGRWINRTMLLAPGWSAPHALAVQWLWNAGQHAQALVELRATFARDPHGAAGLVCLVARADAAAVVAGAPPPPLESRFLETAARCLPLLSPDARAIDARLRAQGLHPGAHEREAARLLADERPLEAFEEANRSLRIVPDGAAAIELAVRALRAAGRHEQASTLIAAVIDRVPLATSTRLLRARAQLEVDQQDRVALEKTLAALRGRTGDRAASLAESYGFAAALYDQLRDFGAQLHALEEANRIEPTGDRLRAVARAAERLGDLGRALRAYTELCSQGSPAGPDCAARNAVRDRFRKP